MRARLVLAEFVVILAAQIWWVVDSPACTCAGMPSVDGARASAEYVFSGRVVSMDAPGPRPFSEADTMQVISSADMIRYVIVPSEIWKGVAADTLVVYSARESASCGFPMALDGEYLLYAWLWEPAKRSGWIEEWAKGKPTGPVLVVDFCSRNKTLTTAAQDIGALGVPVWRKEME